MLRFKRPLPIAALHRVGRCAMDSAASITAGRHAHVRSRPLLQRGPHSDRPPTRGDDTTPSVLIPPYSTTLTIGDMAVPIPDVVRSPERVSWVMPGADHAREALAQAVAATAEPSRTGPSPPPLLSADGGPSAMARPGALAGLPGNVFFSLRDRRTRMYLRWMAQKEALGQDMCLMGEPGPAMRWLVLLYSFLTRREVRVVCLNRDVTESDLKQRREIRNGTLLYEDQSAVAAAREGQLLVLEGLERVERNVLPVVNNLLENREMHLDNGAMLIHPARYDALLQDIVQRKLSSHHHPHPRSGHDGSPSSPQALAQREVLAEARRELDGMGLLRVSEQFRVVGITVPVPPYEGNPLDPPLRSRFQCLYVRTPPASAALGSSSSSGHPSVLAKPAKVSGAAQQEARLNAALQLYLAIEAVNEATKELGGEGGRAGAGAGTTTSTPASTNASAGSSSSSSSSSSSLVNMGSFELSALSHQALTFPDIPVGELLVRCFPWPQLARQLPRGGSTASSAGQAEVQRRQRQYADLVARSGLTTPMLLPRSTLAEAPSDAPARTPPAVRGGRRGASSPPSTVSAAAAAASVRQMGQALRDMMGSGGSTSAADFISSATLVGRLHEESGGASGRARAIPAEVEQACNYISRIENIREGLTLTTTEAAEGELGAQGAGGAQRVVIADAVVATLTQRDGVPGAGPGTFRLPLLMGGLALSAPLPRTERATGVGFDLADVCPSSRSLLTSALYHVLQTMLQLHATRRHICLLGPTGCGKTAVVREFARLLGYAPQTTHLYADMTNKDLFQRRTTDTVSGDTTWEPTALVDAAIHGGLVVLDGIDKLPAGMLASLQQLLIDQSTCLYDGTVLKPPREYALLKQRMASAPGAGGRLPTDADMAARRIFPVHPSFRVIATARPPGEDGNSGGPHPFAISHDATTLFGVVAMPEASPEMLEPVLLQVAQRERAAMVAAAATASTSKTLAQDEVVVRRLLVLRTALEEVRVRDPKVPQLTFRQLLYLVRAGVRYPDQLASSVSSALLLPLMTGVTAAQVRHALAENGFDLAPARAAAASATDTEAGAALHCVTASTSAALAAKVTRDYAVGTDVVLRMERVYTPGELALVPFVTGFYGNPVHESIIAWLARQYAMGSSILLIGNQGVGKNKVVDAFLSRVGLPRHYIQLHRDTTVGSLTINPTVEAGRVRWEDSPLVKAVQLGHCLVVDEIDKASVEVVQVLKGLIEDREMRLGDGRQIVDRAVLEAAGPGAAHSAELIPIHPDFRMIVLANPPGFPFHGNNFFRECGDLFAAYVMGNPDEASQLQVLRAYAPAIPETLLRGLVGAFRQLQEAFEQGSITYPFSLRELIAVVKHLSRFPQDGVYEALNNVFNFDARDGNTLRTVRQVLHHFLSPLVARGGMKTLLPLHAGLPVPLPPSSVPLRLPLPQQDATAAGSTFATVLPAQVCLSPGELRGALASPSASIAAPCWRERLPEGAFAAPASGDFSEWAATMRMPFLDPTRDTVLQVLPLTVSRIGEGGGESSWVGTSSTLLCFLVSHNSGDGAAASLRLAIVHLPPTPLDVAEASATVGLLSGTGGLASLGWPVGEVRVVELSHLLPPAGVGVGETNAGPARVPAAHRAVTLADFNIAAHHELFHRRGLPHAGSSAPPLPWPPSAAALLGDGEGADGGLGRWPAVLVSTGGTAVVLVDVLAGLTPASVHLGVSTAPAGTVRGLTVEGAGGQTAARSAVGHVLGEEHAGEPAPERVRVEHALLSINAAHLGIPRVIAGSPSASTSAGLAVPPPPPMLSTRASTGLVCFAQHNTLYVWVRSRVVAVTLPGPIRSVRFFSATLAELVVAMDRGDPVQRGGDRRALLKLVVVPAAVGAGAGTAHASLVWLPSGLDGAFVDVALTDARSQALGGGASTSMPTTPDAAGDEGESDWLTEGDVSVSGVVPASSLALQPHDLLGAVWVPVGSTRSPTAGGASAEQSPSADSRAAAAVGPGGVPGVAFMVVEGADAHSGLDFRVYPATGRPPSRPGATTTTMTTTTTTTDPLSALDGVRHQLLEAHAERSAEGGKGLTAVTAVDARRGTVRQFAPLPSDVQQLAVHGGRGLAYAYTAEGHGVFVADVDVDRVQRRYAEWQALLSGSVASVGAAAEAGEEEEGSGKDLALEYSTPRKRPSGSLKHGDVDDQEHHGGNRWAGGTGGTDTAGLGGIIGPYRLDKGNPVHQVSPAEKRKVPKHLVEEARRMGREALRERLGAIGMTEEEYASYQSLQERVQPSIAQLRTLLMGLRAAEGERTWLKGQSDGIWDDRKLVEGIVGEKNVFKRRVDSKESNPFQQKHKKRVVFVLDVSASMYRFEGMDRRLTKLLESTIMVMEAFAGFEEKIDYAMIGHNGDSERIPLVNFGEPPRNQKERMVVCQKMIAYAQYCWSGDNTVEAMRASVELVTAAKGDAYFVFVVSDANLRQYGITPEKLTNIMQSNREVQMFCIFIATIGQQSSQLQKQLPTGHGYECMRTDMLPHVLRQIFTSVNLL